jgi:hypothetical protein
MIVVIFSSKILFSRSISVYRSDLIVKSQKSSYLLKFDTSWPWIPNAGISMGIPSFCWTV